MREKVNSDELEKYNNDILGFISKIKLNIKLYEYYDNYSIDLNKIINNSNGFLLLFSTKDHNISNTDHNFKSSNTTHQNKTNLKIKQNKKLKLCIIIFVIQNKK